MKRLLFALALLLAIAPGALATDTPKTLRVAFAVDITGFDPQATQDVYSSYVQRNIFDPLLTYEHLVRPYRLAPNTAATLPEFDRLLQGLEAAARQPRAHGALAQDDGADPDLRAVASRLLPVAQRTGPAVGPQLQAACVHRPSVDVYRRAARRRGESVPLIIA